MNNIEYEKIKYFALSLCRKKFKPFIDKEQIFDDIFQDAFMEQLKLDIGMKVIDRFKDFYTKNSKKYIMQGVEFLPEITEKDLTEFHHDLELYQKKNQIVKKKLTTGTNKLTNLEKKKVIELSKTKEPIFLANKFNTSVRNINYLLNNERKKTTL
tara:strand:- start:89 stop:553 length:465 start_codon:yes stop_codon:yes gene_type:complete